MKWRYLTHGMNLFLLMTILCSCFKDKVTSTTVYTYYLPVLKSKADILAGISNNAPQSVERPGKIYVYGKYLLLSDLGKGIHLIDNSEPRHPKEVSFVPIPGNRDFAIKDHILYADFYNDLLALDISNPRSVKILKMLSQVFDAPIYYGARADSSMVIAGWIRRDTVVSNNRDMKSWLDKNYPVYTEVAPQGFNFYASSSPSSNITGTGGSMASFALLQNRLYAVNSSSLNIINIEDPSHPFLASSKFLGWGIETIYPFKDQLFVGSQTGMFVFSVANPDDPSYSGQFQHLRQCDPVITDGNYAYVTLRSGNLCHGNMNELDVLALNNTNQPELLRTYRLTNPHGLSKDGSLLFVCDGRDGIKIYDASSPADLRLEKKVVLANANDVITRNGIMIVTCEDGLYQFDYSTFPAVNLLSRLVASN